MGSPSRTSHNSVFIWGLCFVVLLLLIDIDSVSVNAASGSNDKNNKANGNNGQSVVSNDQNGNGNGNNGKNGNGNGNTSGASNGNVTTSGSSNDNGNTSGSSNGNGTTSGSSNGNGNTSGTSNGNGTSNDNNGNANGNNGQSIVSNDQNGNGNGNNGKNGNTNGNSGSGASNGNGTTSGSSNGNGNNGSDTSNGNVTSSGSSGTSGGSGTSNDNNGNANGNNGQSAVSNDQNGNGNGNNGKNGNNNGNGNGNGNGNSGSSNGNGTSTGGNTSGEDSQTTEYNMIESEDGSDVARCYANNNCNMKKLKCPRQCPTRVNSDSSKPSCFIDCSPKCETTCKRRKPNCNGYSTVCYDPRFVGGDGVMFYFHGKANEDFCLVSDPNLHINAHFIGLRPQGRTRDFTWVQTLGILYNDHKISIGAKSNVASWEENVDQLKITYDGQDVRLPTVSGSTWADNSIEIERLSETNSAQLRIADMLKLSVQVVPITGDENRIHHYGLPADDVFAHVNVQLNFIRFGDNVDGVLGQTYKLGYVSPVKVGTPVPVVGGEDKFRVTTLFATDCKANKFIDRTAKTDISISSNVDVAGPVVKTECASTFGAGGLLCRRR